MGGGGSKPPPPQHHHPAPPRPPPPPPPPPPKPVPIPPPPQEPDLNITEKAVEPFIHLPGTELFGVGGPRFTEKEIQRLIKQLFNVDMKMDTYEQGTNPKILDIPDIVRRYTKALCFGKERLHPDKAIKEATPKKCVLFGNDLHNSPDFTIFTDDFKYKKVVPPIQKPGQAIIADADNDSPVEQTETVSRIVKVIDTDTFTSDKTMKTGASFSGAVEVKVPIPIPFTPITIDIDVNVENKTKGIFNMTDTNDQTTTSVTELNLTKEITLPPYSHADVIWTINEGELDLPWSLKVNISGNFNLITYDPPTDRLSKSYCGEALKAAFEQKVMYDDGITVKIPEYLQKCGLKAVAIPVCEALAYAHRVKDYAPDYSGCHFVMDGAYKGIHATNYKAQVKVKPYDRNLKPWQMALHRGHKLENFKLDSAAVKSIMKYAKEDIGIKYRDVQLDDETHVCAADDAAAAADSDGGLQAYSCASDEEDVAAAAGGELDSSDVGDATGAAVEGWLASHAHPLLSVA